VCDYGTVVVETLAGHECSSPCTTSRPPRRPQDGRAFAVVRHPRRVPAGSITGAPKRRAIEIIEELEPTRRAAVLRRSRLDGLRTARSG